MQDYKKGFLMLLGLVLTYSSFSQVLIGGGDNQPPAQGQKKDKAQKRPKSIKPIDASTSFYLLTNWSSNHRSLEPNSTIFGDTLGDRANESAIGSWSFSIGLRNRISKHFSWDGGIAYARNGEQYEFDQADTSYHYQTTYSYISMPLRLTVNYGKTVELFGGIGLMPQMFTGYKQDIQWRTTANTEFKETVKMKSGYAPNSFVLSALVNVGVCVHFEKNWSLLVSPELRYQLTSTYAKQDEFIHKNRAIGISFGLLRRL